MTGPRIILLLGSKCNTTLGAFALYLARKGRPFLRAHGKSALSYTIGSDGGVPVLSVRTGDRSLKSGEFTVFVQEPHGMVEVDRGGDGSFSSQEWFATIWSFCGVHSHVVNPPSVGAWGPAIVDKLLRERLAQDSLPREFVAGSTEDMLGLVGDLSEFSLFTENLGTGYRKHIGSGGELARWGRRGADQYGFRTYVADSSDQLLQVFVGERVFTLRNDWKADTESAEHLDLCDAIRDSLSPLRLGFFAVAFHRSRGTTRVGAVFRDVPAPWFEDQSDEIFAALVDLLEGPL